MAGEDYNIIDKLKNKFLTCEICLEEYDEGSHTPRQLPCFHSFCTECIKKLISQKSGNDILCPLDRTKHSIVSSKGVETFPKDNTRRNLLEFIGNQDKSEVLSKECTDNNNGSYRCNYCASLLCMENMCLKADSATSIRQIPRYTEETTCLRQDGAENVFGVVIDVTYEYGWRSVKYKFQGKVFKTQLFHRDGICTDCKTILDLLRRANEKGVLFQKTGGNKITWNKDIPYTESMIYSVYTYMHMKTICNDYLPELKQSLAKYGIE